MSRNIVATNGLEQEYANTTSETDKQIRKLCAAIEYEYSVTTPPFTDLANVVIELNTFLAEL